MGDISVLISKTPTVAATAHAQNDVVGGLMSFDLTGFGGGSILNAIMLQDSSNSGKTMRLNLFHILPSTVNDDAAWSPNETEQRKRFAYIDIEDYITENSLKAAYLPDVNQLIPAGVNTLYAYLVVTETGGITLASTDDIYISLNFMVSVGDRFSFTPSDLWD